MHGLPSSSMLRKRAGGCWRVAAAAASGARFIAACRLWGLSGVP